MRERCFSGFRIRPVLTVVRLLVIGFLIAAGSSTATFANSKYAAIVIDAKTGKTLFSRNANAARFPASLTKMMTLYVLFEELERGRFTTHSKLRVSKYAAGRPPSKLGLRAGQTITVGTAIRALAVKSANDVATVVAEAVEGSESAFAARMTRTARTLGMKRTKFRNASGLPDPRQKTTARDMALLGRALQDRFPAYYKYFGTRTFQYGKRKYRNTNRLLGRIKGVDGIKTGYTRASGFNLVTSVKRSDRHIVAVVMGGKSSKSRNAHMSNLIGRHLKRAKRGKRTAPLLVARRPAPLPRGRPDRPAVEHTQSIRVAALPGGKPASADDTEDLIARQIEQAASLPELAYSEAAKDRPGEPAGLIDMAPDGAAGLPPGQPAENTFHTALPENKPERRPLPLVRKGDWHVQIAAVPTREDAALLLQQVQSKAGSVLRSASPLTQPVNKSGATFYRARFAGFAGKSEARAVCARLKRKSVNCLAVPN